MILRERRVQRDRQELSRQGRERAGIGGAPRDAHRASGFGDEQRSVARERQIHRFAQIRADRRTPSATRLK